MNKKSNWSKMEILWMVLATSIITGLSLYWGDTLLGITSSVTGVICVILTAKGNIKCYYFGLINIICYVIIAFTNRFYGEVILNAVYYLPMQFVGIYIWMKNRVSSNTDQIKVRRLTNGQVFNYTILTICSIICLGIFLMVLEGSLPFIDATSTVLSILAMYLSVNRYVEQWIVWIIINIVSIGMWAYALYNGSNDYATLLMWSAYLLNSFYGYYTWKKNAMEGK